MWAPTRADEVRTEDWGDVLPLFVLLGFVCLFLSLKRQERTTPLKLASELCETVMEKNFCTGNMKSCFLV